MLNDYASRIGESGVTLTEELLDVIIARDVGASHTDQILHTLTIYGLTLVNENARGALSEFSAGRSRSGAALNRCLYEAVVNVVGWHRDSARAVKEWAKLPIFAHREEVRKTGDHKTVPPGVKRDFERYTMEHPELLEEDSTHFRAIAEDVFKTGLGYDDVSFRREYAFHYDVPSLFAHARVLGAEDLYEVSSANDWAIRERSLMAEPNARVLGIVPLLVVVSQFVALRYGLPVAPAARVGAAWNKARDEHNARLTAAAPSP